MATSPEGLALAAADESLDGAKGNLAEADAAMCAGQSFTPSTQVVMADGSSKALDQVKVGEKVLATDPVTGRSSARSVLRLWVDHDDDLMDVRVSSAGKSSVIHSTQHHPFWDESRHSWVEADRLRPGERLRTADGAVAVVDGTAVVAGVADMWDLTVSGAHDFYVDALAASILVHNCDTGAAAETTGDLVPQLDKSFQLAGPVGAGRA